MKTPGVAQIPSGPEPEPRNGVAAVGAQKELLGSGAVLKSGHGLQVRRGYALFMGYTVVGALGFFYESAAKVRFISPRALKKSPTPLQ